MVRHTVGDGPRFLRYTSVSVPPLPIPFVYTIMLLANSESGPVQGI